MAQASGPQERETGRLNVMLNRVPVGARVRLRGGITAEVTANPGDGGWVFVRYLSCPEDPSREGAEELAYVLDVLELLG